jgi:hypothetical protein
MTAIVITTGSLSFGNADIFDRILLAALIGATIYFWNDKSIASILILLIFFRLLEEFYWLVHTNSILTRVLVYSISLALMFMLRKDKMAMYSLCLLSCVCTAELYWYFIEYTKTPKLSWYVALIDIDIALRYLITNRQQVFKSWAHQITLKPLDEQIKNILSLFILSISLQILEYFVRHIVQIQSLFIYSSYPYAIHALNGLLLWVIANYTLRETALFKA